MSSNKENANPLQRLEALGQSVWLDYIQRVGVIIGSKNEVQRVTSCHLQG